MLLGRRVWVDIIAAKIAINMTTAVVLSLVFKFCRGKVMREPRKRFHFVDQASPLNTE